jgi:(2Fe-2S) ferredoxin
MQNAPNPYRKIVFVCLKQRTGGQVCCSAQGSERILEALKVGVKERALSGVRVSQSGCHDLCAKGPSVMLFPDNRWFYHVSEADVPLILAAIEEGLRPEQA